MSVTQSDLVRSEIIDGKQEQVWEISAIREQAAIRKARARTTLKGFENITVLKVTNVGDARLPGQSVFRITLQSPR